MTTEEDLLHYISEIVTLKEKIKNTEDQEEKQIYKDLIESFKKLIITLTQNIKANTSDGLNIPININTKLIDINLRKKPEPTKGGGLESEIDEDALRKIENNLGKDIDLS